MSRASYILERLDDPRNEEFWILSVDAFAIAPDSSYTNSRGRVRALQQWLNEHGLGQYSEHVMGGEGYDDIGIHIRGGQDEAVALGHKINELLPSSPQWASEGGPDPRSTLPTKCRGDLHGDYDLIGHWDWHRNRYEGD